ncbi:hypothetical protein [Sinomicrobium sp.]
MNTFRNLALTVLLLFCVAGMAQEKSKREQFKALKVAYITEKLSLSSEEAEKFWPVYNSYYDKISALRRREYKGVRKKIRQNGIDNISEQEAEKLLSELEAIEYENYQEDIKLTKKLKGIIPTTKILLLKKAEKDFNRALLHKLKRDKSK